MKTLKMVKKKKDENTGPHLYELNIGKNLLSKTKEQKP